MRITQCLHTAILVTDLEKAKQFYGEVLGLQPVKRTLKFSGAWYQIGNFQLHLIVDSSFQSQLQNQQKWGRNPHLAFAVDNLEAAKLRLQTYHYPFQTSASGRAALFICDPDNNVLEISQI